jgi:DNA-binding Lrp family transcriptional regulator
MNNAVELSAVPELTDLDRRIAVATQAGLPMCVAPFDAVAEDLGIGTGELIARLRHLQDTGVIRRIGAVPNHYALGYAFNGMTVWDIADDAVRELGRRVGKLDFVSHCYRRPRRLPQWRYNLFAMVHARDRQHADSKITEIEDVVGSACRAHDVIFSRRILKKTGLRLSSR